MQKIWWLDMTWEGAVVTIAPDRETAFEQMQARYPQLGSDWLESVEEIPFEDGQTRVCLGDS